MEETARRIELAPCRLLPRPKHRRPHPHHGAAGLNRGFQVAAHAHGQGVKLGQCQGLLQPIEQSLGLHVNRHLCVKPLHRIGDGHETAQSQSGQGCHRLGQSQGIRRRHTRFGGAAIGIDLQTNLQWRQMRGALLVQALGNFQTVHALHPIEMRRDQSGFIALQRPDAMPHQAGQMPQRCDFVDPLLHIVFAEVTLAHRRHNGHWLCGKCFGNGQQMHTVCGATTVHASRVYAVLHLLPRLIQAAHNQTITIKKRRDMDIHAWIGDAMARHASDIHLRVGEAPMVRIDGHMRPLSPQVLDHAGFLAWLESLSDAPWPINFAPPLDHDGAFTLPELGRFRFNLMWHHQGLGMVLRPIATTVPTLEGLQCPEALSDWAGQARGLVLITGPTGSGKSSTLAAMVNHINLHQARHVISLEDPIEFVHTSCKSLVTQREIMRDTLSFASGLRAALREDPDVLVVGELRDTESIRLALTAAETGHLVISTLHTNSAASSITRLIDVFEPNEKAWVQNQLSESLLGIASQMLCARATGPGRVAAFEVLRATPAIGQMIRDHKINQIAHALQTGARWGMYSLEQDLRRLVAAGLIQAQQAQHPLSIRPSLV